MDEKVSLAPLDAEDALDALMAVTPEDENAAGDDKGTGDDGSG
jgi:hypothetical protein